MWTNRECKLALEIWESSHSRVHHTQTIWFVSTSTLLINWETLNGMQAEKPSQAKPWTNNTGPQDNTHPSTTPPTIHLQHSGSLPTGHCTTLQYRSLMHSSRNWLGWEGKGTTDEYPFMQTPDHPSPHHSFMEPLSKGHSPP